MKYILIIVVLVFYFWTATNGGFVFNKPGHYRYSLLANSFLKGKLYLDKEVPEGLIKLGNPYDPIENMPYRLYLHDWSLYKNKIYSYFGPSPVVLLYLPYQFFTNNLLRDDVATFVFTSLTFIFSILILGHMVKVYYNHLPEKILLTSFALLAFANLSTHLLVEGKIYQVAISCGSFLITSGIYFLLLSLTLSKRKYLFLLIAGLVFGLAPGSRPHLILPVLFIVVYFLWKGYYLGKFFLRVNFFVSLLLPFVFCLCILITYNYLRFENPLEVGNRFILSYHNFGIFSLRRFPENLYWFLFKMPYINLEFPFFHIPHWCPGGRTDNINEPMFGLVYFVPFILVIPLAFIFRKAYFEPTFNFYFLIHFVPALIIFICLMFYPPKCLRYHADYLTLLLLSACLLWFHLYCNFNLYKRKVFYKITFLLAILSISFGIFFPIYSILPMKIKVGIKAAITRSSLLN